MRAKIVAGNWKMNLNADEAREVYRDLKTRLDQVRALDKLVIIAPPSIYLSEFSENSNKTLLLAAQNCSEHQNGAFTGEISASMLSSLGVKYCLVGHSERRQYQNEETTLLKKKIDILLENQLIPIYCCGESLEERESGKAFEIVKRQIEEALYHLPEDILQKVIIAYEPIWAIGTGKTASSDQAQEIHEFIRKNLAGQYGEELSNQIAILYGGSCKADNAKELFSKNDIDGGLIGGASLKVDSFMDIILS